MNCAQLGLALAAFLLIACAPRLPAALRAASRPISRGIDQQSRVPVGPPEAMLAVWTLEPKAGTPIKGTVLFLHGFVADHRHVQNAAEALRRAGYRAVLLDLRGWGRSTGEGITFGVQDAQDLKELTTYLQQHDLCGPTLGVYGTSYGAATAILYAACDPRVVAVVAVAPFADIHDEVPAFGRFLLPGSEYLSDSHLYAMSAVAARLGNMDLKDSRPIEAITRTQAPILLIHGLADGIVPYQASERLHAAAPEHSELLEVPGRGHLDLAFDIPGELQAPTRKWFNVHLAGEAAGP